MRKLTEQEQVFVKRILKNHKKEELINTIFSIVIVIIMILIALLNFNNVNSITSKTLAIALTIFAIIVVTIGNILEFKHIDRIKKSMNKLKEIEVKTGKASKAEKSYNRTARKIEILSKFISDADNNDTDAEYLVECMQDELDVNDYENKDCILVDIDKSLKFIVII